MLSVNFCLLFGSFCGTARRYLNLRQYRGLQKRAPHAVRHLFVAVIASIISYASRVSTDILTNIMQASLQASLRCCSRIFSAAFPSHPSSLHPGIPAHLPSFSPIIPRAIPHNSKCRYGERGAAAAGAVLKPLGGNCAVLPKVYLKSKTPDISISQLHPNKKAAARNLPAAAYLIIIALPDVPLRFISITLRCHPGYLPQKHPSSFRCATYLFHLFPWRQPSAVVPGRSLWCRSGSARVLQ